jgi:hypothetical protein
MADVNDTPGGLMDFMPPVPSANPTPGSIILGGSTGLLGNNGSNGQDQQPRTDLAGANTGNGHDFINNPKVKGIFGSGTQRAGTATHVSEDGFANLDSGKPRPTPTEPVPETPAAAAGGADTGAEYITNPSLKKIINGAFKRPGATLGNTQTAETTNEDTSGQPTSTTETSDNQDYQNLGNHPHPTGPTPTTGPATAAVPAGFTLLDDENSPMTTDDRSTALAAGLNPENIVGKKALDSGATVFVMANGDQIQVNTTTAADGTMTTHGYKIYDASEHPNGLTPAPGSSIPTTAAPAGTPPVMPAPAAPAASAAPAATAPPPVIPSGTQVGPPTPPGVVDIATAPTGLHGPVEYTYTNPAGTTFYIMSDGKVFRKYPGGGLFKDSEYESADAALDAVKKAKTPVSLTPPA